jgi:hypothetical protein
VEVGENIHRGTWARTHPNAQRAYTGVRIMRERTHILAFARRVHRDAHRGAHDRRTIPPAIRTEGANTPRPENPQPQKIHAEAPKG